MIGEDLMRSWDELNNATKTMLCCQPDKLSRAAERVERARICFEKLFMAKVLSTPAPKGEKE